MSKKDKIILWTVVVGCMLAVAYRAYQSYEDIMGEIPKYEETN